MRFILTYADHTHVSGSTREEFEAAPDHGVQMLRVYYDDGSAERFKALDVYTYMGATKLGEWTTDENYVAIKNATTL